MEINNLSAEHIQEKLAAARDRPPNNRFPLEMLPNKQESAAVLIPLLQKNDKWHVLFIRRTKKSNDRHSGQVAFPGGRCGPEDGSIEAAALRETREEIGVLPQDVNILGRLPDLITITNYRITPVVGMIPWPYQLQLETEEVSRAFCIPLAWLADPDNRDTRPHLLPDNSKLPLIYFKKYDQETLWGASACMMVDFLELIS